MRAISFNFEKYPIVESFFYSKSQKFDLFIICQHGYQSPDFRAYFNHFLPPEEKKSNYLSESYLRYLDIEHDFGARQLAHSIARTLKETLNAAVITVNFDRGIIDANRTENYCIAPLVKMYASKSTLTELQHINLFTREKIFLLLEKYLTSNGYIIDLHSMWPFNLKVSSNNSLDLNEFNELFQNHNNLKSRRKINLIVHDSKNIAIADEKFAFSLKKALTNEDYEVAYNSPYYILPMRSNYHYFKKFKGVAIDIPRDLLGIPRSNSFPDFSFMYKSEELISKMANAFSTGILEHFLS